MALNLTTDTIVNYDTSRSSTYPTGNKPVANTSATISYSAASLDDRDTLTITAEGATTFGATGPELLFASDAKGIADGAQLTSASTFEGTATVTGSLNVEDVPELPQGKGFVIGAGTGGTQNPSDFYGRLKAAHPTALETTKFYEHVVYYWPQAHQENAQTYVDTGSGCIWQIKTIWTKFSDLNAGNEYKFHNSYGAFFDDSDPGDPDYFKNGGIVSSGLVGTSWDLPFGTYDINTNPKSTYMRPDVISQQTEVDIHESTGEINTWLRNKDEDQSSKLTFTGKTGLTLAEQTADSGVAHDGPTQLAIPGYTRGFNVPDTMYMYFADIFYQWGDGAFARVEIANSETYDDASMLVPCEVLTWSASTITAKIRTGVFYGQNLALNYLHIHDATGTHVGVVRL